MSFGLLLMCLEEEFSRNSMKSTTVMVPVPFSIFLSLRRKEMDRMVLWGLCNFVQFYETKVTPWKSKTLKKRPWVWRLLYRGIRYSKGWGKLPTYQKNPLPPRKACCSTWSKIYKFSKMSVNLHPNTASCPSILYASSSHLEFRSV